MVHLDSEIHTSKALVVDPHPTSRGSLVAMLRECGVSNIEQARKAQEARKLLETQRYDIVLCEYHFDGEPVNGQDIMDDLRLAQLLPLSTVVVMISSEGAYAKVAEAAEAALDAYLLKPHTAQALRERLVHARLRKRMLGDIIKLVEQQHYIEAAELCEIRYKTRGPAWLQAARIGAELWLRLGKPHAAQALFEAILSSGAVPWARLGVARTQYNAGSMAQSRRTLESLLNDLPAYADAYDVMGRVLLDEGQPDRALDALRHATSLTPGSVSRLVKHGLLAFYYGEPREAADVLAKAARLGLNSRAYDLQGLVLLAMVQFDLSDRRGLLGSWRAMRAVRAPQAESPRLRRFDQVIEVLVSLLERNVVDAVQTARNLMSETAEPDFDFEAGCNLVALLSRLCRHELNLDGVELELHKLARRFAVSRTTSEMLVQATAGVSRFESIIRQAYAEICSDAEEAVSKTIAGAPGEAVRELLAGAGASLNGKLIDLAFHTLERHRDRIEDAAGLEQKARALHGRYRAYGTQVRLGAADCR
jgi:CheY-like chemotaxis protein